MLPQVMCSPFMIMCIIYLIDIQLSKRHVGRLIAASSEVECQVY